ncbi:unnamed protein product [Boreogadus saida]
MPGGWTVLVCVALLGCWGGETAECECKACIDLDKLDTLLNKTGQQNAQQKDLVLLNGSSFNQIRVNRKLHACVLMEVLRFFRSLLKRRSENDLPHFFQKMEHCVRKDKNQNFCPALKREASRRRSKQGSRGLAMLQIYQLDQAYNKLDNESFQEQVMEELQGLKAYVTGSGFKHYQLI